MIPAKRRYSVGVTKIPHADRDLAHRVLANDDRRFLDVIGSDTRDDDDTFPVGSECTYALDLTPEEAREFEQASNCRYIEPDLPTAPATTPGPNLLSPNGIPTDQTFTWMGCNFPRLQEFHGQDIRMCVMDQGTNALARSRLGINLVGRAILGDAPPNGAELHSDQSHGCFVSSNMVPAGGQLLDAMIVTEDGKSSGALFAAGVRWACDNGANVINYSFSGYGNQSAIYTDAINYMNRFNCVLFAAAGNDSLYQISVPATFSRNYPDRVASAIAFDERTNAKASFSNYSEHATGCAPGVRVLGVNPEGYAQEWSGTSAASPNMATLCGRLMTGHRVTAKQSLAYLRQYARNTGQSAQFQGGGAFDLGRVVAPSGGGNPGGPGDPGSPFALNRNALLALL